MHHKIKKVKTFSKNEQWFLPPENIKTIRNTLEAAIRNAPYSVNPIEYCRDMQAKLDSILELEKIDSNCTCGIKFSGKILYIPTDEMFEPTQ